MLDRKFLIQNKELYEINMQKRNEKESFEIFENLYNNFKNVLKEVENLQAQQNKIKEFNEEANSLKEKIAKLLLLKVSYENELNDWLLNQPNFLLPEVPVGKNENENQVIFESEKCYKKSLPHFDLIENLVMKEEASNLSGSRFLVLKSELSALKNALVNFMLEHNKNEGYEEYSIPYIVNESSLYGSGQLPKFSQDAFATKNDQWLISTGEVSLVNLFQNKIFKESDLPKLCMTYSPCFRKEAGSAGKDTKGLIRLHQFHKVELVTFCKKEDAENLHIKQLKTAENILKLLELPYRIILICSGDTGFTATKQYDIEVWMPGMQRYLEIASCSQCGVFQAMRANIKYKTDKETLFAHTLNGSALPLERLIAAIIENYYDLEEKCIKIPKILEKYLNNQKIYI